jgi:hypothetical protein
MTIEIKDELATELNKQAKALSITIDELVNNILLTSTNAMITLGRIEYLLDNEIVTRLASLQANVFATRHQVMNFHADASESSDRAIAIAEEATDIGFKAVYSDEQNDMEEER